MARVLSGKRGGWSAKIRCAHPVCGLGRYRVDGCFAVIKIIIDDVRAAYNSEDSDWTFWVNCPLCQQQLYIGWQIGESAAKMLEQHFAKKQQLT